MFVQQQWQGLLQAVFDAATPLPDDYSFGYAPVSQADHAAPNPDIQLPLLVGPDFQHDLAHADVANEVVGAGPVKEGDCSVGSVRN